MSRIKLPVSCAVALVLAAATQLHAQQVTIRAPTEKPKREIAPAPVPEGQIVPVADEGVEEDSDDMSVPEPTQEEVLVNQFQLFKQLMQDRVFDEADTVAKRIVEIAIRAEGPQSNEYAKALTNLAIVQHHTEQYEAAQQNFEAAIEIIEDNEDRLNAQLVNPLKGLGAAQLEGGRPDLAKQSYGRAVHVTHVNEGPHNLDQIEILESIAETNLRMGDLEAARDVTDSIYALQLRKYSTDQMDLVEPLMRRAAWQHRAGFIFDERTTYRRVIRIIEVNAGKDDPRLVKPLIMLGRSFFFIDQSGVDSFQDTRMSTGEIYFRRAVRIAEENPDADWRLLAEARLRLGDYYMHEGNAQRGRQVYNDVWTLLSDDEDRLDVRRKELETIVPLRASPLPEYVDPDDADDDNTLTDDPLLRGKITVHYEISPRGRVSNLKLVAAEPADFTDMQRMVQREVRQRLFRPRYQDAQAVASPDQHLEHTFFYRQSELDKIRAAATADQE